MFSHKDATDEDDEVNRASGWAAPDDRSALRQVVNAANHAQEGEADWRTRLTLAGCD
jgi:hypothetical protein